MHCGGRRRGKRTSGRWTACVCVCASATDRAPLCCTGSRARSRVQPRRCSAPRASVVGLLGGLCHCGAGAVRTAARCAQPTPQYTKPSTLPPTAEGVSEAAQHRRGCTLHALFLVRASSWSIMPAEVVRMSLPN